MRLINSYGLHGGAVTRRQVLIQSFSPASLRRIHALDPELPLIQLMTKGSIPMVRRAAEYSFGIGLRVSDVDRDLVELAHSIGLAVHVYPVTATSALKRIGWLCVDGMFTNAPGRYRALIEAGTFDGCADPIR